MVCYICAKETNFFVEGQINKEALFFFPKWNFNVYVLTFYIHSMLWYVIFVRKKQISLLKDKLIKKHFFFPEVKLQCLCFDFVYTFYVMVHVCYICAKETNFFVEGQINKEALMNYKPYREPKPTYQVTFIVKL